MTIKINRRGKVEILRRNNEKRDTHQPLQNLIKKNKYALLQNISGNFTSQTKGTSKADRLTAENSKLIEFIKILENQSTSKYKITLSKWPKKRGCI